VLTELKDLKQTVASLVEPVYEDERDDNVEQDDEELTAAGVDKRAAGDTGTKPTEKASGSKLLAEIVQEMSRVYERKSESTYLEPNPRASSHQ